MTRRKFLPPNFRCRLRDKQQNEYVWLMRSESEEALREHLKEREYEVLEIADYDFEVWKRSAEAETARAVAARGSNGYNFRSEIWSEIKQYLFELFDCKCAYCEARVRHVSYGDVEHYRPKRPVVEEGCSDHPGYYWLAYDVSNLLPSCQYCNQYRKKNRFPVKTGFWARCPAELDREEPLLLNPYNEKQDPREHLEFRPVNPDIDVPVSIVRGRTEEGRLSIETYALNRPGLIEERGEVVLDVVKDWTQALLGGETARARFWLRLRSGEEPYSLAQLEQLQWVIAEQLGELGES